MTVLMVVAAMTPTVTSAKTTIRTVSLTQNFQDLIQLKNLTNGLGFSSVSSLFSFSSLISDGRRTFSSSISSICLLLLLICLSFSFPPHRPYGAQKHIISQF